MTKLQDTPIRVGMIGAGYMTKLHSLSMKNLAALTGNSHDRFDLIRLIDSRGELAQDEAARWGWMQAGSDWRTVTQGADIDLVDIATPNANHYEMCLDAFAHGKHVLCENPLAVNRYQATEMARQSKACGKNCYLSFYR